MPRSTQIIPEHQYPHQMVVINDNTQVTETPSSDSSNTRMLFVFASPKGEDGKVKTIETGLAGFLEEYGTGPFSLYGQPLLNAYNAAASGACTLHCLRVSAPDAAYSVANIVAQYKIDDTTRDMTVRFVVQPADAPLADLDNLDECYTALTEPTEDGYTEVKLFSVAYIGKGSYGDNFRIRISSNTASDKENSYKNYVFEVYVNDGGLVKKEEFLGCFNEDAIVSDVSQFIDAVVNEPDSGSEKIQIVTYMDGFNAIVDAYNAEHEDSIFTINDFDVLLGINKYTKQAIEGYSIDTISAGVVALNSLSGVPLSGGSDGSLAATVDSVTRQAALETAYLNAYSGATDVAIKSKNKFPTNIILDANFSIEVKKQIAALASERTDCVAILDCGTGITTKQSVLDYVMTNLDTNVVNRVHAIEGYAGKIKDPYSKKIVTVTGTYGLAADYPIHFQTYEGKHIPLAGNNYGVLSGYVKNSIYPIFDEDIDSDIMDELVDNRINFARVNANQDVIRATQTTRQDMVSNLSELSNVFILLDIKRDCERMCTRFEFNFSEAADIARFNAIARDLLGGYSNAQVRSISAYFDKNTWEAERGILHLYVEFVHKDLVKTKIIEIDVNRS